MPLNDTQIRNAKPKAAPYRLTDGHGLQLEVRPSGAKFWRYRYRIDGRENMFAAGEYAQPRPGESAGDASKRISAGKMTLAEARVQLLDWRSTVKRGEHPVAARERLHDERRRAQSNTFRAVAEGWVAHSRPGWSPSYAAQVERTLRNHMYPKLGGIPISEIGAPLLTKTLTSMKRMRKLGDSSAQHDAFKALPMLIKQWCSAVFRHAIAEGLVEHDPTYALRGRVRRVKATNHVHLSCEQIGDLWRKLEHYGGSPVTIIALRLLLLTFVRPGELRNASWHEFDFAKGVWNIPAERMKMRLAHMVPLSAQAMAQLKLLHSLTGRGSLLFPNQRDSTRAMSATTLNRCLERIGFNGPDTADFSAHGFRATASTLLNESGKYREDAIERQLAHVSKNEVRGTYNKAKYSDERAAMMQDWADTVERTVSTVR